MAQIRMRHTKLKFWKFSDPYNAETTDRAFYDAKYAKYDNNADFLLPSPDAFKKKYFWDYYAWREDKKDNYNPTKRRGWRNVVPFRLANSITKPQIINGIKISMVGETFVYPHGFASLASVTGEGPGLLGTLFDETIDIKLNCFIENELNPQNNVILSRNGYQTEASEASFYNLSTILKYSGDCALLYDDLMHRLKNYQFVKEIKINNYNSKYIDPGIFSGKHHAVLFLPHYFCEDTKRCNVGKLTLYNRNIILSVMQVLALIVILYDLKKAFDGNQVVYPDLIQLGERSARLLGRLYGRTPNSYNTILNRILISPHKDAIDEVKKKCGI